MTTILRNFEKTYAGFNIYKDCIESWQKDKETTYIQTIKNLQDMDNKHRLCLDYSKNLADWLSTFKSESNTRFEITTHLLGKIQTSSTELTSCCSKLESKIATDLVNSREALRKLFSLKEYKQTGETPQKKLYRYPRTLLDTKPEEMLVEEYYSCKLVDEINETEDGSQIVEKLIPAKGEFKDENNDNGTKPKKNRQNLMENMKENN